MRTAKCPLKAFGTGRKLVVLALGAHGTLQLTVRVAFALGVAFVVFLFTFTQRDFALDQVLLPVNGKGHAGIAFLLNRAGELFELALVQQQFSGACRVSDDVRAGSLERRDVATHQPGLAILEQHVTVDQLYLGGTQAFYFPASQDQTGLELVFDEVIVTRLFILRDGPCRVFLELSHRGRIIGSCINVGYGKARA